MDELEPGLHEALVTEALRARIERARSAGWLVEMEEIDDQTLAVMLARHIHDRAIERMAAIPASATNRRSEQIVLANRVLDVLSQHAPGDQVGLLVDPGGQALFEVDRPNATTPARPRPGIPLTESALLVNAHRDLQIGTQVALEILSANRVDLLCAFVRWAGVRLIRNELQQFLLTGHPMRVIASVYTGSTQKKAIDDLVGLGAKVKISYDTAQTRLHAKAWLFTRNSGFDTAYVGSSNLTEWALLDGLEWNVRLTSTDNREIVEHVRRTFEQYWNDPEFELYDPQIDGQRLEEALASQAAAAPPLPRPPAERPNPKPFQVPMLDSLQAERLRGHLKNLVVAPTGTGKTWVSAFDYARLRASGYERLLFVAHRDEILQQSQNVFRAVLRDEAFGERHVGSERPSKWTHVFASIQSLHRVVDTLRPDQFDVVIVDEFHHAEADTYRKLLQRLSPRILVGLTATPERADGNDILHWFDDRIAYEMRLWEALDRGLLCPFHYFGVGDGTDLRSVRFERGRYVTSDLEGVLTGDHVRAKRILDATKQWVLDTARMRALGFCAGIAHARFMAEQFTAAGLPAVALDGSTDMATRRNAIANLRNGEIRAIFTVDIFNEGVDIPEVDTLLLLRPTESATVFLQQLGRGLRWSPNSGKNVLTVLDFIGQSNAEYRFDIRYRALIGGTRAQIRQAIEHGFPLMPPGCAIRLDEIAQGIVLDNLRMAINNRRRALIDDLRGMPPDTSLPTFLGASSFDLTDIYSSPGSGTTFTAAKRAARHLRSSAGTDEAEYSKAIGRLLHVNDDERYVNWRAWLDQDRPPVPAPVETREGRLQLMLFAGLGLRSRPIADMGAAFGVLWGSRVLRSELIDLLDVLRSRGFPATEPVDALGAVPIHSHASYTRHELVAAYGAINNGRLREWREGVMWVEPHRTDVFYVTLDKSSETFSPTTRYNDYPISPTQFHWESQSTTSATSPTGQRYIDHVARGSRVVLFVREVPDDDRGESNAVVCLGPARYVSHKSSRPMQIVWELERPMPPEIYDYAKAAAG